MNRTKSGHSHPAFSTHAETEIDPEQRPERDDPGAVATSD